jgi:hypothetical protein
MRRPNRSFGALGVAIMALVLVLGGASTALAASDPTLGLTALKTKLDASGTIPGYFKTVDKGSTIETIPVTVLAVTGGATSDDALIMFEATGSQIDKFGGIVAGMSGSPVYVDDGGADKVIGAVSYGDYFTKGGTGLATPIEAMRQIRSEYLPEFVKLSKPLITTDGVVKSVIVAPRPQDFKVQSKEGAFVANPLSSVFIGGLNPNSAGYRMLSKVLASRGQSVVPLGARLAGSPAVGDQSFETTLVPGAAVAALQSRGDMWIGGVGTVTYTDTDTVLAFGHPAFWAGNTSLYMTNAWVDGVWPSTYVPYKVARPTALRGTITEDRSAGILGVLDEFPTETTLTARATNADKSTVATSAVYMSRSLLASGTFDPWDVRGIDPLTAALSVYVAGSKLMNAQLFAGSAEITTTVLATDGTATYTVTIPNRIDGDYDVPLAAIQDAATAIAAIQRVPTDGVHDAEILSVDLTSRITAQRKWAKIVGVKLPKGLKVGANRVQVEAVAYGRSATQTVDATITIPTGTSLSGNVVALSQAAVLQSKMWQSSGGVGYSSSFFDSGVTVYAPSGPNRDSLAEAVDDLNATLPNNVVTIMYVPNGASSEESPIPTSSSIMATVSADWVFSDSASVVPTRISAVAEPSIVNYGGQAWLSGSLMGPSVDTTVAVYATPAGGTEQYVGTFPVAADAEGEEEEWSGGMTFSGAVGPIRTTTSYRIHFGGTSTYSAAEAILVVRARAKVTASASARSVRTGRAVTLRSTVWPKEAAGSRVVFEYNDRGKHWRTIATKTLTAGSSSATAATAWRVARGAHKVRVRYLGGTTNAASTSAALVVTGR